ncbi:hypothetical protein ACS0TY_035521 [Phlomoides rotata]
MSRLSEELHNKFGDDFDEHSLSEDDGPSNDFETAENENVPSNNVDTQAQGTQSNHTENEVYLKLIKNTRDVRALVLSKEHPRKELKETNTNMLGWFVINLEVLGRIRLRKGLDAQLG